MKFLFFLGLFCVAVILYSMIENRYIRITEYVLGYKNDGAVSDNVKEPSESISYDTTLSIVQLSDLHDCRYGKNNHILLKKIEACKPDVIILTGDMKNKYKPVSQDLYRLYENLSKICPCIYSLGNHELKDRKKNPKSFSEYINKVKECGIIVSENETHLLQQKGISCLFASYSSTLEQYKKRKQKPNDTDESQLKLPEANHSKARVKILLSHDPELIKRYQESEYSFIFSGHLHGGIVRIPGYRGVVSPRFVFFPQYAGGCYKLDEKHLLIVSRGLGSHTIKFRLFNRPEVVHSIIHMKV